MCGAAWGPQGDHAVDCVCGPLCTFRHEDLADICSDLELAGGLARCEVYVAELSGTAETWFDVWGWCVAEAPRRDVQTGL